MKYLLRLQFFALLSAAQNATISIPSLYTYNLPNPVHGNITQNFVNTHVNDSTISALLSESRSAAFIFYDPEFLSILGTNATLRLVAQRPNSFAAEAGVWIPNRNEVWFTGTQADNDATIFALSLSSNTVYTPNTSIPIPQANGGYYFNGTVYITSAGNGNITSPAIYSINPDTKETSLVINSYFGVPMNGPDDVTWIKKRNRTYMYFTDPPLSHIYAGGPSPQLPDTTWRFNPDDGSIVPAISRGDVLLPNGIRVNAEQTKMFVTDTPEGIQVVNNAVGSWASNAIYVYDIDEYGFLGNKRMFGLTRNGISDGIHVDDTGRVWTAETEGVVVRNAGGKIIGLFNNQAITGNATFMMENFALAGDTLIILDMQTIWAVKLAETVITAKRCNDVGC